MTRTPIRPDLYSRSIILVTLLAVSVAPALLAQEEGPAAADHISAHERWVTSAAFSPDGSLLATVGGQSLQYRPGDVILWDAESGSLVGGTDWHRCCDDLFCKYNLC